MIKDKKNTSIIRSSAAEYLIFVAASGKGGIEAVYIRIRINKAMKRGAHVSGG